MEHNNQSSGEEFIDQAEALFNETQAQRAEGNVIVKLWFLNFRFLTLLFHFAKGEKGKRIMIMPGFKNETPGAPGFKVWEGGIDFGEEENFQFNLSFN